MISATRTSPLGDHTARSHCVGATEPSGLSTLSGVVVSSHANPSGSGTVACKIGPGFATEIVVTRCGAAAPWPRQHASDNTRRIIGAIPGVVRARRRRSVRARARFRRVHFAGLRLGLVRAFLLVLGFDRDPIEAGWRAQQHRLALAEP